MARRSRNMPTKASQANPSPLQMAWRPRSRPQYADDMLNYPCSRWTYIYQSSSIQQDRWPGSILARDTIWDKIDTHGIQWFRHLGAWRTIVRKEPVVFRNPPKDRTANSYSKNLTISNIITVTIYFSAFFGGFDHAGGITLRSLTIAIDHLSGGSTPIQLGRLVSHHIP